MRLQKLLYRLMHWESWQYRIKYLPIAPVWLWYCLRARSFWFFTPSNPSLTFGGFEGETKTEMYACLPPGSFPKTVLIDPGRSLSEIERIIFPLGFAYPFVVKPDVGMMGLLFRRIDNPDQLSRYAAAATFPYLVQELVGYAMEISIFYYRYPRSLTGNITGMVRKEGLEVTGDGLSTLKQLILKDSRCNYRLAELCAKHGPRLTKVIPEDERVLLSDAFNLSRSAQLVDINLGSNDRVLSVLDSWSHASKGFYYGRYDIKCESLDSLENGENFSILEFNGCGAEPHHIYGNGNSLLRALQILVAHWKILYKISQQNRQAGISLWRHSDVLAYLKAARKHFKQLRALEKQLNW